MSHDLLFCVKGNTSIDAQDVLDYFRQVPGFQVPDTAEGVFHIPYANKDTGVYFHFDVSASLTEKNLQEADTAEECHSVGISFHINHNRPSFFAYESMPIVEAFAKRFQLLVVDLEADGDPQECKAETLINSWQMHDALASVMASSILTSTGLGAIVGPGSNKMPEERALAWWRYAKDRDDLQKRLGTELFAPRLWLVRKKGENEVSRGTVWTSGRPIVIPECELFLIGPASRSVLGKTEEGVATYDEVIDCICQPQPTLLERLSNKLGVRYDLGESPAPYLKSLDDPLPGLHVIENTQWKDVKRAVDKLKLMDGDDFLLVRPDSLVLTA